MVHAGPTSPFLKEHPEFTFWNPDGTVKKGPWRFPILNFQEPKLRRYLMDNIKCLMRDFGADGFRCDVGTAVPLDFWHDAHDMMDALTGVRRRSAMRWGLIRRLPRMTSALCPLNWWMVSRRWSGSRR